MKHSKLPWRKITFPDGATFIQADRNKPEDRYDIEVLGEDVNPKLYPQEQKDADTDLILRLVNNYPLILNIIKAYDDYKGDKITEDLIKELEGES